MESQWVDSRVWGAQAQRRANPWTSQISAPSSGVGSDCATPVSQAGYRRLVPGKGQNLTLLSIEVQADTRQAASGLPLASQALFLPLTQYPHVQSNK
jgi:hypothetical protein